MLLSISFALFLYSPDKRMPVYFPNMALLLIVFATSLSGKNTDSDAY